MTILSAAVGAARMTAQIAGAIGEINQVISNGKKAEESLEGIGNSAKVASAEVQKLPGKFADLFGAIQSGQASAGTFLKFGADLVQSFGGVGAAARGVMSLVTPFNAAVAAAGLLAEAYKEGSKEADQYARVIALTGNAAGTSVSQLQAMAEGASRVTGSQAKAAEVLAALAGTGQVASGDLEKFAVTAIQMERNVGVSVADTVKHFAELGASPVEASRKLNSQYGYLTASVYSQIKALKEQGDTLGAAGLAQQTYERAMANVSTTMEGRLGLMERSWRALGNVAAKAWDKMLNIGREDGVQQQLADTSARIAVLKEQTAGKGPGIVEGEGGAAFGAGANVAQARRLAELKMLEEKRAFLQESVRLDKRGAEARAQRNQDEKDAQDAEDKIAQRQAKGLSEKQKLKAALNDYDQGLDLLRKVNPKSDALNPEAMARGRQSIIDEFTRKRSGGTVAAPISVPDSDAFKQYTKTMAEFSTISSSAVVQTENLSKTQAELRNIQGSPVWAAYSRQQQEQIILAASLSQADEDRAKAAEEAKKKLNQAAEAQRQETVATVTAAAQAETELANYGLLKSQVQELALTKLIAARDSEALAGKDVSEIEKRIDAQKRLVAATKGIEAAGTKAQAAKEQEQEWKRTSESINKSLTDAFMKSLESGKDFGKNLGNALKEQFKSLVLKPTISAIMSPISGMLGTAVSAVVGGSSNPQGGGVGVGGIFNLAGSANGAYNLYQGGLSGLTAPGSMYYNFATSGIGQSFGLSNAAPIIGNNPSAYMPVGTQLTAPGAGASTGAWSAAGWGTAIFAAFVNLVGGFKTDTQIGSGLTGKLDGRSTLSPWQEWREGGSFASGPSFETHNPLQRIQDFYDLMNEELEKGDDADKSVVANYQAIINRLERDSKGLAEATVEQSKMIQSGYALLRTGVVDMANSLGIAGDSVANFVYELDQQDLNFQGLKPEEIQKKISDLYAKTGDTLTKQFLGAFVDEPKTVAEVVGTVHGSGQDQWTTYERQVRETSERTYKPSEYAKNGETAYQTLQRLAASFHTLNEASDALGFGIHQGSLMLADFADDFIEAFGGLERFNATTGAFLQNYYSDEERREYLARSGSRRLEKLGINVSAEQLLGATGNDIKNAVNSVVSNPDLYGDVMDIANYLAPLYQGAAQAAPAVENLTNAVDELTQKFTGAKEVLLNDAKSLSVELLRAQGKEGQAKALERENYLAGFSDLDEGRRQELATQYDANTTTRRAIDVQNERNGLQDELNALTDDATQALTRQRDALDESNRALFDHVQAVKLQKTLAEELPGVLSKYMLPAQRRKAQYESAAADLSAAGIHVTGDQLANASKEQFAAAAMSVYNLGSTTDGMRLALVRAAGAIADIKDAEVDEAFANIQRMVAVQQEAAEETKARVKAVFDLVKSSVDELYSEVDSTMRMQAAEGQDVISKALATAQSTGELMDAEKLGEAISAARQGLDGTQYASQFERDRDRLVLAGKLSDLEEISGEQLSEAEAQLKKLEGILDQAQIQVDELRGIHSGVGDVNKALQDLTDAINGRTNTPAAARPSNIAGRGEASFDTTTGRGTTKDGVEFERQAILNAAREVLTAAPDGSGAMSVYNALAAGGYTLSQYNEMFGMPAGTLEQEAQKLGMKVFHRGTPFVPNTGFALLQRGEAVIPTAYNPFVHGRSLGDTARLEAHLEKLTDEVMRLQGLQTLGNTHAQATVELLDNVTEGGNGIRAEIMNKVELVA